MPVMGGPSGRRNSARTPGSWPRPGGPGRGRRAARRIPGRSPRARRARWRADQLDRLAVLHRDQAGRPDEVGLLQPAGGHLLVVVLVAEVGPVQLEFVRPLWPEVGGRTG